MHGGHLPERALSRVSSVWVDIVLTRLAAHIVLAQSGQSATVVGEGMDALHIVMAVLLARFLLGAAN